MPHSHSIFASKTLSLTLVLSLVSLLSFSTVLAQQDSVDVLEDTVAAAAVKVDLPAITVTAHDTENDNGGSITLNWIDPGYDTLPGFAQYYILRHHRVERRQSETAPRSAR